MAVQRSSEQAFMRQARILLNAQTSPTGAFAIFYGGRVTV